MTRVGPQAPGVRSVCQSLRWCRRWMARPQRAMDARAPGAAWARARGAGEGMLAGCSADGSLTKHAACPQSSVARPLVHGQGNNGRGGLAGSLKGTVPTDRTSCMPMRASTPCSAARRRRQSANRRARTVKVHTVQHLPYLGRLAGAVRCWRREAR